MNTPRPLSNKLDRIAPFYVMEIVKQAQALEHEGRKVIHLSIGEPDFKAPPAVHHALAQAIQAGHTGYTHACGIWPLRQALSRWYAHRWGIEVDPRRIVVTGGASSALTLAALALINPDEHVLMSDPSYPCNRHFIAAASAKPVLLESPAHQRYHFTPEQVRNAWGEHTAGVLIASPANPTGTSMPYEALCETVDWVGQQGGFAMVDEIYQALAHDTPAASILAAEGARSGRWQHHVVVNSFSKYFSMTGWRLGWLVVPDRWIDGFERLAQNLTICASAPAQWAALACFEQDTLNEYERRRQAFTQRRNFIVPALKNVGLNIPAVPDSAFFLYADVSASGLNSEQWCQRLLHEHGVCVVPGKDFSPSRGHEGVRISFANGMDALERAVEEIGEFLVKIQREGA